MEQLQAEPESLEELQRVLAAKWDAGEIDAGQVRKRVREFKKANREERQVTEALTGASKLF